MIELKQGQSTTIGILIADGYDMSNIDNVYLYINQTKFTPTIIDRMLRVEMSSKTTSVFIGTSTVRLIFDDKTFGRREYVLENIVWEATKARVYDDSVDLGYTVTYPITISETAIEAGDIMYDYVKGSAGSLSSVTASVDSNVGTPEVIVTYDGENADFAFKNLKGEQGIQGEQGEKGDDAVLPAGTVIDPNYVHTDNNYTTADKAKVAGAIQTETDPTVPAWAKEPTKPTYTASEVGAEPTKSADDNYVTDLEKAALHSHGNKTALDNVSGVNTGDQDLSGFSPINHTHSHTALLDKNAELTSQHLDTTAEKTTPIDADSFGLWDSVTSTFKRLSVANMLAWFRGLPHTFTQMITFSGGVKTDTLTKINGSGSYINEDGGTIWHTTKWFTNSGTFSSNGTAVTTTSGQLTSAMIGAKIGTGTDKRIITAVANSNSCTVNSAFSQNYSGVSDWGVWSRHIVYNTITGNGSPYVQYSPQGDIMYNTDQNNFHTFRGFGVLLGGTEFKNNQINAPNTFRVNWSNSATYYEAADVSLYRPSPRTLKIYDGQNTANAGDLIVRSVQVSDNTAAASITTVGMTRYRADSNNSYTEICMQTGASTYAWVVIKQNTW